MTATIGWNDWSCSVRVTLAEAGPSEVERAELIVRALMDDVARSASRFRADSDIERVNAHPGLLIPVRPLTIGLVGVALEAARRTGGAVDPTVGAHVLDAGYTDDIAAVRGNTRATSARPSRRADWTTVTLDRELGRVGVPAGLLLDLGATAKAWTADEAARRITDALGTACLVGIGGDLAAAGAPSRPWRIDVAETEGGPTSRVDVTHGGLATSSTTGRSWTSRRGVEHHVIDPATSRPTTANLRTATLWAPSALVANTWSTAALVWGDDAGARLGAAGLAARLVSRSGQVTVVGGWPEDRGAAA